MWYLLGGLILGGIGGWVLYRVYADGLAAALKAVEDIARAFCGDVRCDSDAVLTNRVLAAAAGALVALRAMPGSSLPAKLFNLVMAFLVASFAGPLFVDGLGVTSARISAGIVFLTGAGGLVLLDAVVKAIEQTPLGPYLRGILSKVFPQNRQGGDDHEP